MGSAKDKHGVRERFAKENPLFAKNGRSRIKEFWSTAIYTHIYIYTEMIYKCLSFCLFTSKSKVKMWLLFRAYCASCGPHGPVTWGQQMCWSSLELLRWQPVALCSCATIRGDSSGFSCVHSPGNGKRRFIWRFPKLGTFLNHPSIGVRPFEETSIWLSFSCLGLYVWTGYQETF